MSKTYEAKDIQVLEGLDAVRMRPGMYIGTTGTKGLHHLLWEIVDNAVDEAANGFADRVEIVLHKDNSVTVCDNGRGIPVDIHPQLKISGVEVVFTQLHAGGKFNNENYAFSGGLHGVGASVTNALSEWLTVEVCKNGKMYRQQFHSPVGENGKILSGVPKDSLTEIGKTDRHGSTITFLADSRVFKNVKMDYRIIAERVKELAFLNKGITFDLTDERADDADGNMVHETFCYEGGLRDFVMYLNENKAPLHISPMYWSGQNETLQLEFAFQYTSNYTENFISYVNNIPTGEGGMHETGVKTAMTKAFNDYARSHNFLKAKEDNLLGEDFREGITIVMSVKMANVQFEGQTKTKLGNVEARIACEALATAAFAQLLEEDPKTAEVIIKKSIASAKVREAARKAKEVTRQKNSIFNSTLIGKLASCTGRDASKNELFIVEGDSAGGSAKQARNRRFQAILPLRGKPLNAERKRIDQVLGNEEIRSLISALDTGIGEEDFNIDDLKYDKIIILSDADQDGAHIRAILLTFFFRYMKPLITEGHVYIGMPPLYKLAKKGKVAYAYDDYELQELVQDFGKGYDLQRYKGLGEMNAEQLWETTMNPESRTLMRVTIENVSEAERMVTTLMGDQIDARKQYIIDNADFNKDSDKVFDELV
ncbi:MAG: type IIA DNA topoisomerase subunit B [Corallococcus sp.]|nr:type IIA DNA topoisomerase subunit B [Corallococcus sp.]MCM1359219.1 type IIA DNA topoisomerase subunit B [Corallococcus sp.]MCM1394609.1 type IIA DNA topoisomerase subunit B [Corallococcus sp.]